MYKVGTQMMQYPYWFLSTQSDLFRLVLNVRGIGDVFTFNTNQVSIQLCCVSFWNRQ